VPHFVREIGPVFSFISFAAFLALLVLYVLRAIEIRRLRRAAPFLAEKNGRPK
jgi:uncharacterized protein YggT (Ycf19 family)